MFLYLTQYVELVVSDTREVEFVHGQIETLSPGHSETPGHKDGHGLDRCHERDDPQAVEGVGLEAIPVPLTQN